MKYFAEINLATIFLGFIMMGISGFIEKNLLHLVFWGFVTLMNVMILLAKSYPQGKS